MIITGSCSLVFLLASSVYKALTNVEVVFSWAFATSYHTLMERICNSGYVGLASERN